MMKFRVFRRIVMVMCAWILLACGTGMALTDKSDYVKLTKDYKTPSAVCGASLGVSVRIEKEWKSGTITGCSLYAELYKNGVLYGKATGDRTNLLNNQAVNRSIAVKTDPTDLNAKYTLKIWFGDAQTRYSNELIYENLSVSLNNCAIHSLVADKQICNVNDTITWEISFINTNGQPHGEADDLYSGTYTVTNLTTGRKTTKDYLENGPGMIVAYQPTAPGLYNISIDINIIPTRGVREMPYGCGMHYDTGLVEVLGAYKPQIQSIQSSHSVATAGSEVTWSVTSTGDDAAQYQYSLYRGETLVSESAWVESTSYTATLSDTGTYTVSVIMRDEKGDTSDAVVSEELVVTQALEIDRVNTPAYGYTDRDVTCSVSTAGSTDTAEYMWKLYRNGTLLTTSAWKPESAFVFSPNAVGTYTVSVRVRNADGEQTADMSGEEIAVVNPPVMDKILVRGSVAPTISRRWHGYAVGGYGKMSYHFQLYHGEKLFRDYGWSTCNYVHTYEYTDGGEYTMVVSARDENGRESEPMSQTFTVQDAMPSFASAEVKTPLKKKASLAWKVAFSNDGDGLLQYRCVLKRGGKVEYESGWLEELEYTAPYQYTAVGDYTLTFYCRDEDGDEGEPIVKNFYVDSIPVITGVVFSTSDLRAGQPFTITALVEDGEGDIYFTFRKRYRMMGATEIFKEYEASEPSTDPTISDMIEYPTEYESYNWQGNYYLYEITATDEDGNSSTYTTEQLYIKRAPFITEITLPTEAGKTTESASWTVKARTDRADTTVVGILKCDGEIVSVQESEVFHGTNSYRLNTFTFTHTFDKAGTYVLEAYAKDDIYTSLTKVSEPYTVIEVRPQVTEITPGETEIFKGDTVEWTVQTQGYGTGYTYFFRILRNGEVYRNLGWKDENTCSFTFDEVGQYTMEVRVSSQEGYTCDFAASGKVKVSCIEHVEEPRGGYDPTCEEPGKSPDIYCSACGELLEAGGLMGALGHTSVFTKEVPATHITAGITAGSYCSVCQEVLSGREQIPVADVLVSALPASLKQIDEQAFAQSTLACVVIPEGCQSVGERAFESCGQLRFVEIPFTVTQIAENAFVGCREDLVIVTAADSYAQTFARERDIACVVK